MPRCPLPDPRYELITIPAVIITSHALIDHDRRCAVLIDGGFLGDAVGRIERTLKQIGLSLDEDVEAILLTHGHLDHTLNLAELIRRTGASLYAPVGEESHVAGEYPYRGLSRICGLAEAMGRWLFHYEVPTVDHWFRGGDELPFWGGLKVIALPGHTGGHCGFYSESQKLLLAGDLFANFLGFPRLPPAWFNVDNNQAALSLVKADELVPADGGVIPNHARDTDPSWHRQDLADLARRVRTRLASDLGRGINPPP